MIQEIIKNQNISKKQIKKINFEVKEPKMIQLEYYKALKDLVNRLKADVNEILMPVLQRTQPIQGTNDSISEVLTALTFLQTKYSNIFAFSFGIAQTIVNSVNRYNKSKFNKKAESQLGVNIDLILKEGNIKDLLALQLNNQINLIKSIPQEFFKQLEVIISNGFSQGQRWETIAKEIKGVKNISSSFGKLENRVKMIARDQVGNINANLNKIRQQNAGIEHYEWASSMDEKTRPSHKALEGKICKWSDPEVYADNTEDARNNKWKKRSSINGVIGIPGSAGINCRCSALAVFLDFD